MKNMKKMYLGIVPIAFILLGFVNMQFGMLGVLCFGIPFTMLFKTKSKVFCNKYCFRIRDFELINRFSFFSGKVAPKKIKSLKKVVIVYFLIAMAIVTISTIMVAVGRVQPLLEVRFLLIFKLPIPQLIKSTFFSPWLLHLSYRLYSMVLTTFILGAIMSSIYKTRTWCVVCPYNTIATEYIKYTK